MQDKKPTLLSPALILLDIIGTVLLGLGLAKYFANIDVIPESMRFENYAPILIGMFFFGAVQMLFIGLLGEYVGAIYTHVRKLPLVVESERVNFELPPIATQNNQRTPVPDILK